MYDYIVVGAGSAGSVIAARLSEDPDVRVLLIEAGGADSEAMHAVPALWPTQFRSQWDWADLTEPEPGLDGRRRLLSHGKTLGGSSSMNAMIYIRGHREDYDEWAELGAEGWGYDDVLDHFKKAEDNERGADDFHGTGGPLTVSDNPTPHPVSTALVEAGRDIGLKENDDFNGAEQEGVGLYQRTIRGGQRCSTAVAYLRPAADRPNLEIRTHTLVNKVVIESGRAVGVEVQRLGEVETLRAEREVVVSAGAYNTARILMLSGIGVADELTPLGLDVVADLPVGRNLQDHAHIAFNYRSTVPTTETLAATPEALSEFEAGGTGPLSTNLGEMGGFFKTAADVRAPDVQIHSCPILFVDEATAAAEAPGFMVGPTLLRPFARGHLRLRSLEPSTALRITHNYLADERDLEVALSGMRSVLELTRSAAMKDVLEGPYDVPDSESTEDLLRFARSRLNTLWHPVGSCSIGQVVDPQLRVLGVEGLRVADASVMPTIPRGNTNAPTIMVAEKAAAMISA